MTYILALDQGTTSSRCLLFDQDLQLIDVAQHTFEQHFPQPGWVEHDPDALWQSQRQALLNVIHNVPDAQRGTMIIGITNQRETTLIWDKHTGHPVYNAIVWQDRRTARFCEQLRRSGNESLVTEKTGLLLDPYFSASKIRWILDHVDGVRARAERGELAFGTVDSWLLWQLTDGQVHLTDVTNASRTSLFNIDTLQWDEQLLELFGIPASLMPEVRSNAELFAHTTWDELPGIDVYAMAGDQHAALFGQQCWQPGSVKCTYGTGSFLMMNSGPQRVSSKHRLLSALAWQINGVTHYALEGSIFTTGSLIQWLRDGLQLIDSAAQCEALAGQVEDNGGVVIVPALTGLGAPHWDADARGTVFGLTRGTNTSHICRAALESICLQVDDVLQAMRQDTGMKTNEMRIDGGAVANNLLVQLQADIAEMKITRPQNLESTALGIACMAGIAAGYWTQAELAKKWKEDRVFSPVMSVSDIAKIKGGWQSALDRSGSWL